MKLTEFAEGPLIGLIAAGAVLIGMLALTIVAWRELSWVDGILMSFMVWTAGRVACHATDYLL